MLNLFKRKKKLGLIYWVNMDKIVIQPSFLNTQIRPQKYETKKSHYLNTGEFASTVVLTQDNVLIDGYSTYLIAQEFDLGKIPVVYIA